jgi:phage tail-like protein
MAVLRDRPYPGFNFLVDLSIGHTDGPDAGFSEVVFPEFALDVIEYRNGNAKENGVIKLTGLERHGNVVLKRGVVGSLNLYQWWNQVRNGDQSALRTVVIHLQNEDHSAVVLTWKLLRARPVKLLYAGLKAAGQELAVEHLELAFERIEME